MEKKKTKSKKNYDARKVTIGTQRRPPQQPDDYVPLGQNRILRVRHRSREILQNREMFETSLRGIRPGKRRQRLPQSHTNEDGDGELISARVNTRVRRLHEEEDGLDDVSHHACSEVRAANLSGDCHLCVRCCWCWCCCWLLRFCENALVLANSFFTFDETFVIF